MLFDHILVTTDFSEESMTAFDIATFQAKAVNARITLLSVIEPFSVPVPLQRQMAGEEETMNRLRTEYETEMREKVVELAKSRFHQMNVKAVTIFSSLHAAQVITDYAKQECIGLIILASQGKGKLKRFFLGSVAQGVIQNSFCPIMVIPHIDEETED